MRASKSSVSAILVAVLCLGLTTGCSNNDGTGPSGGSLDPSFVGTALAGATDPLVNSEATLTFAALAPYMGSILAQAPVSPARAAPARIPSSVLGATFAWDEQMNAYVEDPSQTGAPTDGVRFLLYEVGQFSQVPTTPLNEIGFVDMRDLSSGGNIDLEFVAVIDGVTQLDFSVTGTLSDTQYDLTADGSFSDGTTSGDFTYALAASVGGGTSLSIDASADHYSLAWSYDRTGAGGDAPGSDRLTLQDTQSGAKVEFIIDWNASFLAEAGSVIKFNGTDVADVTGSGGFIEVTPRDGSGLDDFDAQLLASGYFDVLTLNAQFISLARAALESLGYALPYV